MRGHPAVGETRTAFPDLTFRNSGFESDVPR